VTPNQQPERGAAERTRAAALWLRDTGLGGFGFALVLLVALSGWSASFLGLHSFGVDHMSFSDNAAWLVPLTFDGAPAGLSIVVMRASIHGRSAIQWRILIIAFTALSSWINYQHIDDDLGRCVASFMPPSAVILFEGLMSEVRAAAERRRGRLVRERVHPLRWCFDWTGTVDLYRRHILGMPLPDALDAAAKAPQPAASERLQSAIATPSQGATVSLVKRPRAATTGATNTATGAPQPTPQSATPGATNSAMTPAIAAPPAAPQRRRVRAAQAATVAPRRAATQRPKSSVQGAARDAIEALYGELGRRPLESEMIAVLKAKKLPKSRQFANARRLELERENPALAALGSQNVRPLTGS